MCSVMANMFDGHIRSVHHRTANGDLYIYIYIYIFYVPVNVREICNSVEYRLWIGYRNCRFLNFNQSIIGKVYIIIFDANSVMVVLG